MRDGVPLGLRNGQASRGPTGKRLDGGDHAKGVGAAGALRHAAAY